jgi:hypothetical protein
MPPARPLFAIGICATTWRRASLTPTAWDDGGTPRPLQAACFRSAGGWTCSCPADGAPTLPVPDAGTVAPAFVVELAPGARPGLVVAVATGCTSGPALCAATSDTRNEAAARIEVALDLVRGLRAAPAAALTLRGDVDAGSAALGLHNRDIGAGILAVHAGGRVAGEALRLSAPAGSALDQSIVSGDAALAGLDEERFFRRWFGMGKAAWAAQPAMTRIACDVDCSSSVVTAFAAGRRLVSVTGELSIDGPATLGTAEQPIVLVVSGALRLHGAVSVNGLVFAAAIDWRDAAAGAGLSGAALAEGDAAADFSHDAQVLARLHGSTGSFARVGGSWRDF